MKNSEQKSLSPRGQDLLALIKHCITGFIGNGLAELVDLTTRQSELRAMRQERKFVETDRLVQLFTDWPRFVVGDIVEIMDPWSWYAKTTVTPEHEAILSDAMNGENNATMIDFGGKFQVFGGRTYQIGNTIMKLSSSETKPKYLGVFENETLAYSAYIGGDGENKTMFLLSFNEEEGVIAADNIEEFCILSEITPTDADAEDADANGYIFTCFNRLFGVTFTTILPNLKDAKLSQSFVEELGIDEPRSELLDGCYHYIKALDAPLSRGQKRFLVGYNPQHTLKRDSDEETAKMIALYMKVSKSPEAETE